MNNDTNKAYWGKKFKELANLQRGEPESAMLKINALLHEDILGGVIMHCGDINHRMNERCDRFNIMTPEEMAKGAAESTRIKIGYVLPYLNQAYGFEREVDELAVSHAAALKMAVKDFKRELQKRLYNYAKAHAKLPAYNIQQQLAREACIALGECRWEDASKVLTQLLELTNNETVWGALYWGVGEENPKESHSNIFQTIYNQILKEKLLPDAYDKAHLSQDTKNYLPLIQHVLAYGKFKNPNKINKKELWKLFRNWYPKASSPTAFEAALKLLPPEKNRVIIESLESHNLNFYRIFLGGVNDEGEIDPRSFWTDNKEKFSHRFNPQHTFRYIPEFKTIYWWEGKGVPESVQKAVKDYLHSKGYEIERHKDMGRTGDHISSVLKVNRFRSHGYRGAGLTS